MNYIVMELQTNGSSTANIVTQYGNLPQAEQKFYQICSSAVVSAVDVHGVMLVDETGFLMKNECFKHLTET